MNDPTKKIKNLLEQMQIEFTEDIIIANAISIDFGIHDYEILVIFEDAEYSITVETFLVRDINGWSFYQPTIIKSEKVFRTQDLAVNGLEHLIKSIRETYKRTSFISS